MKDLRIALFTGNYNNISDGVSLTLNRWVRYLQSKNIPVMVFAPTTGTPQFEHAGELVSVPSVPMPRRPEYRFSTGFPEEVRQKLLAFNPTLIHVSTPDYLGYRAVKFSQEQNIQIVASYHTHFTSYFKYYNLHWLESLGWRYLKWFYAQVRHLYVPSGSIADVLVHRGISKNIRIWARGVEVDLFSPEKRDLEWRRSLGIEDHQIVVTFVSRLVWEKDIQSVIETFKRIEKESPNIRIMIVGDGPARTEMQYALKKGLFPGFLRGEDLARAYASSDIFFFPSVTETFGNVTLEAMSSGLPAVVANAPGSSSLVEHAVNGFILPPKNPVSFAEHILLLARNKDQRIKMGHVSRQKALSYSWPNIHAGLLSNYMEALMEPVPEPKA